MDVRALSFRALARSLRVSSVTRLTVCASSAGATRNDLAASAAVSSSRTLDEQEHLLYTHGSIPFYKSYPGLYVPRPLGVRPRAVERPVVEIASEILELTKLNWNRARLDGRLPITLLTAQRVGDILRHVDSEVIPAPRYANYM